MTISENNVRQYHMQAAIGARVHTDELHKVKSLVNSDPQAVQKDQATLSGAFTVGILFALFFVLDGATQTASYTTLGTEASLDEVAAALAAVVNANPDIRGALEATATGAGGLLDLDGLSTGKAHTVTSGSANVALAVVQAAAVAARIPFGRLILHAGYANQATDPATELGKIASTAAFAAQVDTLEIDFVGAATYILIIEVDGVKSAFSVAANTNSATTVADIISAIAADTSLAALGLVASDGGAGAGTTHGLDLTVPALSDLTWTYSSATGLFGVFTSNKGPGTSLAIAVAGVSELTYAEEQAQTPGIEADYPPNAGMSVVSGGQMWVELEAGAAPVKGGSVWVDLAPGTEAGRFYTGPGTGRTLLPASFLWERGARTNSNDLIGALAVSL